MRDMDFISPSAMMSLFSDVPLKPKAERGFEQDRRFSARLLHDLSSHPPPHTDSTLSSCQGKARRWVKLATVSHAHRPCTRKPVRPGPHHTRQPVLKAGTKSLSHQALRRESMKIMYRWGSDDLLLFIMTAPETSTVSVDLIRCVCAQRPTQPILIMSHCFLN